MNAKNVNVKSVNVKSADVKQVKTVAVNVNSCDDHECCCENCNCTHDSSYGSGRFCCAKCARGFSTKNKREEINKKVSKSLSGRESWVPTEKRSSYVFSVEDRKLGGKKASEVRREKAIQEWKKTGKFTNSVKSFIMEEQNNKCAVCHIDTVWKNKPIIFILNHIDGNSKNNSRDNLRFVCPNCNSQLNDL